jgi:ABC-type amino acid transport substrate-binding protein
MCRQIAAGVQKSLGLGKLDLRFVPVTAANRVEAVAKGTVDIECGSTTMSLSRQEQVDFTYQTFVDGGSLLVVDGLGIRAVPDLKGKRVAVIPGTTTAPALEAVLQRAQIKTTVVPVKTHEEGLAALEKGTADAYASDRTILIGIGRRAAKPERYALADEIFSYEPHGFMVRRDDSAFRLVANRAIAGLYRSGDIVEIYRKWFGDMGAPGTALRAMYLLNGLPE